MSHTDQSMCKKKTNVKLFSGQIRQELEAAVQKTADDEPEKPQPVVSKSELWLNSL